MDNLRYADDTVILPNSSVARLMESITKEGNTVGLKVNAKKDQNNGDCTNSSLQASIHIYNRPIKNVPRFRYLSSWITKDLNPDVEIRIRIEYARFAFVKMKSLLTNTALSRYIRYRFGKHIFTQFSCMAWKPGPWV